MNRSRFAARVAIVAIIVNLLAATTGFADLPPIKPRPNPAPVDPKPADPKPADTKPEPAAVSVPMVIRVDSNANQSVLKIPKKFLAGMKLGLDDGPAAPGSTRTLIAGLAMSLGIAGAFFMARSRKARVVLVVMIVGCAALVAARQILANSPAPPEQHTYDLAKLPPLAFAIDDHHGWGLSGKVTLQIVDDDHLEAVLFTVVREKAAAKEDK